MKIKTRLAIAFITITVVPIALIYIAVMGLVNYQGRSFQKNYGLNEQIDLLSGNSMQVFNRLTQGVYNTIRKAVDEDPAVFDNPEYLESLNSELEKKYSYLILRRGDEIVFSGSEEGYELAEQLSPYDDYKANASGGFYMDGEEQHLLKQIDFKYTDGEQGSLFIVTNVGDYVPEIKTMISEMMLVGVLIICFTAGILIMWVYRALLQPLNKLQEATKQIRDGNLDFTLDVDNEDEIGMLCQDFEEMRLRLKESSEEKLQYDKESKELISNISHDLKTPLTVLNNYLELLGDDAIASNEKERAEYIGIAYHKNLDLQRLIHNLFEVTRMEAGTAVYRLEWVEGSRLLEEAGSKYGDLIRDKELSFSVGADCAAELLIDRHKIWSVLDNLVYNALRHTPKGGSISLNLCEAGQRAKLVVADTGEGIGAEHLPHIFQRFYKVSPERGEKDGSSGLGLYIVKNTAEAMGGTVEVDSRPGKGTVFTLTFPARVSEAQKPVLPADAAQR